MAYTYRDSLDDYNARLRNSEPSYKSPAPEPGHRGGMAGAFIAIAVAAVMNRSSTNTAKGPSSSILPPVTDGRGGTAR
jgi:hypothetical protein